MTFVPVGVLSSVWCSPWSVPVRSSLAWCPSLWSLACTPRWVLVLLSFLPWGVQVRVLSIPVGVLCVPVGVPVPLSFTPWRVPVGVLSTLVGVLVLSFPSSWSLVPSILVMVLRTPVRALELSRVSVRVLSIPVMVLSAPVRPLGLSCVPLRVLCTPVWVLASSLAGCSSVWLLVLSSSSVLLLVVKLAVVGLLVVLLCVSPCRSVASPWFALSHLVILPPPPLMLLTSLYCPAPSSFFLSLLPAPWASVLLLVAPPAVMPNTVPPGPAPLILCIWPPLPASSSFRSPRTGSAIPCPWRWRAPPVPSPLSMSRPSSPAPGQGRPPRRPS